MAVKIRLQRHGRKKRPFYHIVATDSRNRRDGKFIERIGMYNPVTKPATIEIDHEKAIKWLACGAQPTDTVRSILSATGVLYKKHLYRGVAKGAFSQEEADRLFKKWLDERLKKSDARFNIGEVSSLSHIKKVSSTEALQQAIKETAAPVAQVVADVVETVTDAVEETVEMIAETVADAVETVEEVVTDAADTVEDTMQAETEAPAPEEEA